MLKRNLSRTQRFHFAQSIGLKFCAKRIKSIFNMAWTVRAVLVRQNDDLLPQKRYYSKSICQKRPSHCFKTFNIAVRNTEWYQFSILSHYIDLLLMLYLSGLIMCICIYEQIAQGHSFVRKRGSEILFQKNRNAFPIKPLACSALVLGCCWTL